MTSFNQQLNEDLTKIKLAGNYRALRNNKSLLNFSSNDYFSLAYHPAVTEAAKSAITECGFGAGSSRLVSGNHHYYDKLEQQLSSLKKTDRALIFSSGYTAMIGVLSALTNDGDLILADKLIHASAIDGTTLSGAKLIRFKHNHLEHAASLLANHRSQYRNCIIITESIFSMDGDYGPISDLHLLAQNFDANLIIDDAHGLGIVHSIHSSNIIWLGTLSKALGSIGGYVAGNNLIIEHLINKSRSLIYSTALPPAALAAASAALEILAQDGEFMRTELLHLSQILCDRIGIKNTASQIVPIIIGSSDDAATIEMKLQDDGYFVTAIRPPTVPTGTSRLRITVNLQHNIDDICCLADIIKSALYNEPLYLPKKSKIG